MVHHLAAAFREMNVPDTSTGGQRPGHAQRRWRRPSSRGVRKFVYCSTCGVHGNVDHPPGDEDAPIQPADYYQRTKYEAEPLVRSSTGAACSR